MRSILRRDGLRGFPTEQQRPQNSANSEMLYKRFKIQFFRSLTLKHFDRVPKCMQSDLLDYKTLVLSLN